MSCLLGSFALGPVQVRASRRETPQRSTTLVFHLKTAREARLAVHHTRCPSGDGKRARVNAARNLAHWRTDFADIRRTVVDQFDKPRGARAWVARSVKETLETDATDQVVGSHLNHGR